MKKKVLFVDDERSVLDGLRRSLRRYRDHWDTHFAEGGELAIEELSKAHFDVVVSDMRMPGMDGYELLCHVREHYPSTLRLILSGQTEKDVALRAIGVSHQFLAKPCEGEDLRKVLDRACAVRALCTDEKLQARLSGVQSLPSVPSIFLELTEVLADEESCAADVAQVIEKDSAMSAKVLQVVNSAYLGLPREVSKIQDAVSFLGMGSIRALTLAEGAFSSFEPSKHFSVADMERMQSHGMLVGEIARVISPDSKVAEQAQLAGVLHNIGNLILALHWTEDFAHCQQSLGVGMDLLQSELECYGTTHGRVGAYLLGSWGLPLRVTEAVAFHHDPSRVEHDEFSALTAVHVADALMDELLESDQDGAQPCRLDEVYLERLGLTHLLPQWRKQAEAVAFAREEN